MGQLPILAADMANTMVQSPVYEDAALRIVRAVPSQPVPGELIVVFGCGSLAVRHQHHLEFIGDLARIGHSVIYVIDKTLSFYARPGMIDRIVDLICREMAQIGVNAITTIGQSLGAFGAVAFAERLPVRFALAMAPRFSPDMGVVRDQRHVANLKPFLGRFPFVTLEAGLNALSSGAVLHGLVGPDLRHLVKIQPPAHVDHWLLPGCNHGVPIWLRQKGRLAALFAAAAKADRQAVTKIMNSLHAIRPTDFGARRRIWPGWVAETIKIYVPSRLQNQLARWTGQFAQEGTRP